MKLLQHLSATLILVIGLAACTNDDSKKETAEKTDAGTTATPTTNTVDDNQQKLEANKKTVTDFIQALYGDKDSAAIDKYLANDVKQHNPILQDGKDWLKTSTRALLSNPNIEKTKVDIKQIAADGDKVWVYIKDVAPNGKVFARVEIFRIENGKIAENWLITQPVDKTSANKNSMF